MNSFRYLGAGRRASTGVVLPMSLVVLLMISLIAIAAIRGVTTEEQIASNVRLSTVAFQAAELALKECETLVWTRDPSVATLAMDPSATAVPNWQIPANWTSANAKLKPSATAIDTVSNVAERPACMMDRQAVPPGGPSVMVAAGAWTNVYTVTARGYTNGGDFQTTVQSQLRPALN